MNLFNRIKVLIGRDNNFGSRFCYSQDGEDLILERLLDGVSSGFYIDIGAHHPIRFSNTYLFYLRGWRGINIDAEPGSMRVFKKYRDRDINVECGVAKLPGTLTYHRFNEPALNTFDEKEAKLKNRDPYKILQKINLSVRRLDDLLKEYLPSGQNIDFMSVDVEGKDLEVLESNDWDQYRPRFILAETLRTDILSLAGCPLVKLLISKGYKPIAKSYNTTFFVVCDE